MPFSALEVDVLCHHVGGGRIMSRVSSWIEPSGDQWLGCVLGDPRVEKGPVSEDQGLAHRWVYYSTVISRAGYTEPMANCCFAWDSFEPYQCVRT